MSNPQQYQQAYESGLASTRSALERFLKEDGTNVFDKKIWSDKTKATGQDVNSLLDTGAPGLQWFERALIRYHRCGDVGLEGFGEFAIPRWTWAREISPLRQSKPGPSPWRRFGGWSSDGTTSSGA